MIYQKCIQHVLPLCVTRKCCLGTHFFPTPLPCKYYTELRKVNEMTRAELLYYYARENICGHHRWRGLFGRFFSLLGPTWGPLFIIMDWFHAHSRPWPTTSWFWLPNDLRPKRWKSSYYYTSIVKEVEVLLVEALLYWWYCQKWKASLREKLRYIKSSSRLQRGITEMNCKLVAQ